MAIIQSLDISWQSSHKRKGMPVGFRNLGNTCYLNSVLQCLTYTPPLANFCVRAQHSRQCEGSNVACPFCLLECRIARSLSNDVSVDSPHKIYKCLQNFAKHFRPGRQEDAHELLRYAIDACDNVCIQLLKRRLHSLPKGELPTVMKEIFGGCLQSQIKCLSCIGVSSKLDSVMDLNLDILHTKTLKDAISKFFQSEVLDGSNKYKCEKCGKLSAARKQMFFYQAPNVLAIQLKRFENFFGGKIDAYIEFEEKLKLGNHMSKASQDLHPDYSLYAVIVHSGLSQYGGHYYAYVKDPRGQWFCCNDSSVSASDIRAVVSERAYILFYVRDFPRPPPAKEGLSSASSTPSPPPTPDPVTLSSNSCAAVTNGHQGPKLKFSISRPATKLYLKQKVNTDADEVPRIFEAVVTKTDPSDSPKLALCAEEAVVLTNPTAKPTAQTTAASNGENEDGTQEQEVVQAPEGAIDAVQPEKRQRESLEIRLKDFKETAAYKELFTRLEKTALEELKQSGWCDNVRKSFRAAKRCRESANDDTEFRKQLRRQVPDSVKDLLVQQLQEFVKTEFL